MERRERGVPEDRESGQEARDRARGGHQLLRDLIAAPARQPSRFVVGLAFLSRLSPEDARLQLRARADHLDERITGRDLVRDSLAGRVARVALTEAEFECAMWGAQWA